MRPTLDSKEASFYKMMNDSNHRVMLFLLEILMNSETALSIEQLSEKLFSKNVSEDMQEVCGFNAEGLKCFIKKYPSLFQFDGNLISAIDMTEDSNLLDSDWENDSYKPRRPIDITEETEAVKYFQTQLAKQESPWMSIRSLAGHLSQASQSVRKVVGSQALFRQFIKRHPHVFQIRGDFVSVRDNFSSLCLSQTSRHIYRPSFLNNTNKSKYEEELCLTISDPYQQTKKDKLKYVQDKSPFSIDSLEFQAVKFLKVIIHRKTCTKISINHLFLYLARAPIFIRNCIGWSKFELEKFIRRHSNLFHIDKREHVTTIDTENVSSIIKDPHSNKNGIHKILNHCGIVFHVTKFWGIVDLGHHEHVFFDKSIFQNLDDLQKHFEIGECIHFNAVLAPKQSRAKWRAIQVWKEFDNEDLEDSNSKFYNSDLDSVSCDSIITNDEDYNSDHCLIKNKKQINLNLNNNNHHHPESQASHEDIENHSESKSSTPTHPSPSHTSIGSSNEKFDTFEKFSRSISPEEIKNVSSKSYITRSVGTQTISTGDIMAIQVYLEILHI